MIKSYKEITIEHLSGASTVPLEQKFNNYENCIAEWCFKTRSLEERNIHNDKYDKSCCKTNDNQLYNLLKKNIFPFQTNKFLK